MPRMPGYVTVDGQRFTLAIGDTITDTTSGVTWTITEPFRVVGTNATTGPDTVTEAELEARRAEWAARRDEERRQRQREYEERRRLEKAAHEKARETFYRMLTPRQLEQVQREGAFLTKGSKGNTYQILVNHGCSGNINLLGGGGERLATFCCHPNMEGLDLGGRRSYLPTYDAFLAQKLMIEADEPSFLRTTVLNSGRRPDVGVRHGEDVGRDQCCICKMCEDDRHSRRWSDQW